MAGSGRRRPGDGGRYVVVVESPAKAKTLARYLGPGHRVIATRGHVSDLPAKAGSVRPDEGFAMTYRTGRAATRKLGAIAKALAEADGLVLATDPDREGEAIAWQVLEWLGERDALAGRPVFRAVFGELTGAALGEAMARPRGLDLNLVRAWQARRALDYLVGYGLSPLLWRKLPGCRSAGRVQSVALRLLCEREAEIEAFAPRTFWTVEAEMAGPDGARFTGSTCSGQAVKAPCRRQSSIEAWCCSCRAISVTGTAPSGPERAMVATTAVSEIQSVMGFSGVAGAGGVGREAVVAG